MTRAKKTPGPDLWQERVRQVRAARDQRDRAAGIVPSEALTADEIEELRAGVVGELQRFKKKQRRSGSWLARKIFGF